MSDVTKKRLSIIINVFYLAMILAAFYLVFKTFAGVLMPFIVAAVIALILHKPVSFIVRKTPVKRGAVSVVFVLLLLVIAGLLISLIGIQVVAKIKGFVDFLTAQFQNLSGLCESLRDWCINFISFLPEGARTPATESITEFFNSLIEDGFSGFSLSSIGIDWSSLLAKSGGALKDTVVQIPSVVVAIVISIIASIFITIDFNNIRDFFVRQFPDKYRTKLHEAKLITFSTLKKMFKAYSLIVLITTTELCIGLFILKLIGVYDSDYIVLISVVIAIIDIVPVLGTGTVLVPWAIYSFISNNVGLGIGLVIIYAVILVVRQIIEPKLVAGQAGLSPIVTIIAMYIGTKTLGILGFFILPFAVIIIKELNEKGIIHLFKPKVSDAETKTDDSNSTAEPTCQPDVTT